MRLSYAQTFPELEIVTYLRAQGIKTSLKAQIAKWSLI